MSSTDKAIGMAIVRIGAVAALVFGAYTITQRVIELSALSASSLSAIAQTAAPLGKSEPRLPSDAEVNRMHAMADRIDVLSNNLANAETVGFKRQRADVSPRVDGTMSISTQLDMTQGPLESTGIPTDLAIQGDGFFKIRVAPTVGDGTAYTRKGVFVRNKNGDLVVAVGDGLPLIPNINIPTGATNISISQDGTVQYTPCGGTRSCIAGQILLSTFVNPQALIQQNGCIFLESPESGGATVTNAGEGGSGQLMQGYLEQSNVDQLKEKVALLRAERLLEDGTKPISAAINAMQLIASTER